MRNMHRTLARLGALLVAVSSVGVVTNASALPARSRCDAGAQAVADCVGWSGTAQDDPDEAAVRSLLLSGRVSDADHFHSVIRKRLAAATEAHIAKAVTLASRDADLGAESLTNATTTSVPQFATASRTTTNNITPMASYIPPQASHGELQATGPYHWTLHGSASTPLYYGYCDVNGCKTVGSERDDWEADTAFPWSGVWYDYNITHSSGVPLTMTGVKLRVMQDVSGGTDPTRQTLPCATSGYQSIYCSGDTNFASATGAWYYFRLDIKMQPQGYPSSTYQGQTRRWHIVSSSNWPFEAYSYYGG